MGWANEPDRACPPHDEEFGSPRRALTELDGKMPDACQRLRLGRRRASGDQELKTLRVKTSTNQSVSCCSDHPKSRTYSWYGSKLLISASVPAVISSG